MSAKITRFVLNCSVALFVGNAAVPAVAEIYLPGRKPVSADDLKVCYIAFDGEQFPVVPPMRASKSDRPIMSVWDGRALGGSATDTVAQADLTSEGCEVSAS